MVKIQFWDTEEAFIKIRKMLKCEPYNKEEI